MRAELPPGGRWAVPVVLVVAATALRGLTSAFFGEIGTFLPFLVAIPVAAYLGGRGPGYLALAFSLGGATLLSITGRSVSYHWVAWLGYLALFSIVCAVIVEGIHRLRATTLALRASFERQQRAWAELDALEQRMNAERRHSDERLRAILDHASAIVFLKDREGRYLFVNEEFIRTFDLSRDRLEGRLDSEVLAAATITSIQEHDAQVWAGEGPLTEEETVLQPRGLRTYIVTKFLLPDATGKPYALCGIATDISERKATERALIEADRRKDVFLATLAHELRNPLAPIRTAVKLLERAQLPPDAGRARDIIGRQSRHMALLLDDLLDITRVTRGTLGLTRTRVDLASVVEAAVETARPLIDAASHTLTLNLPQERQEILADPLRLAQILANLLTNAAKYTQRRGTISLDVTQESGELVFRVRDSGIGIAKEDLPRLFEMFGQLHPGRDRLTGGLGIGLALTRGLVELHGGRIEAQSEGVNCGSEFTVRLPLVLPSNEASDRRILIADDNEDSALGLQLLLSEAGYQVRVASDGVTAFRVACEFQPQFVVLDIGMPRMNGYEVAEKIRMQRWGRDTVLIALTGWGQVADRRTAIASGFDIHLTKPVDPADLQAQLEAAIERRKSG